MLRYSSFGAGIGLVSVGLELFLRPNWIVPGGVQGISIMLAYITEMQMGLFLFLLHLPFVLLTGVRRKGFSAWMAWIGLLLLAAVTMILHPVKPLTEHPLAASIFGGLLLGIGTGLMIRNGEHADGVRETAFLLRKKTSLSMSELVMLIHIGILALAGLLFGWEQALYSIIAYFLACRSLQFMLQNRFELVMVWIKTRQAPTVKEKVTEAYGAQAVWVSSLTHSIGTPNELFLIIPRELMKQVHRFLISVDPIASVVCTPIHPSEAAEYTVT
nr:MULTISPECIES: YitT family protein [unclassified Paenibacillus]